MERKYSLLIIWILLYPLPINASAQAKETEMISYTMPVKALEHAEQLKQVLDKHDVFKNENAQKHILEYVNDSHFHVRTLSQDAYILPDTPRYESKVGWKGSFLPIVYMCFCNRDTQLCAFMAKKKGDQYDHRLLWDLNSGQLVDPPCKAYFDLELEDSRPPEVVQAESDDKQFKALAINEFYPNDDEYPAPGKGAYKPQYQATVDIVLNCTYKQLLAYVFLRMGI